MSVSQSVSQSVSVLIKIIHAVVGTYSLDLAQIVAIYFQNTYDSLHRQYIHVPSVCIYYLCLDLEFM